MEFFQGKSKLYANPKLRAISPQAFRVCVFSWAWSAERETDGHLPDEILGLIGATPRLTKELVAAGLWHRNGTGYVIHDWLQHNKSKEQLDAARAKEAAKKAKQRAAGGSE